MNHKPKPFGLVAVMVYAVLGGLICVPTGLLLLMGSSVIDSEAVLLTVVGLMITVMGVLYWCAVIGIRSLSEWGRNLMFWLSVVSIPLGVLAIFPVFPGDEVTSANTILQLFGIGVSAAIIHYLLRPAVRELFS